MSPYHLNECFLVRDSDAARTAARLLGPNIVDGFRRLRFCPDVLFIYPYFVRVTCGDHLCPSAELLAEVELAPYGKFFRENEIADALEPADALRVRVLHGLARNLKTNVAYWFHRGNKGLVHEYAFGAGAEPLFYFNELEALPVPSALPASAPVAALWYIGERVPNFSEGRPGVYADVYNGVSRPLTIHNANTVAPRVQFLSDRMRKLFED